MTPKPRSAFQIVGWVILIALLGLSFFLLPMVMTMMHRKIPQENLSLWLPLYVLVLTFPVMAAHFYWSALRRYMSGFTFWLIVSAATLGLVLLHRMTFEERIFSNHREVVTFFVGAFIGGTLGGMIVFGLVSRFVPRWLGMTQTQPDQSDGSGRQKNQIGLNSIFVWTTGIAVLAAAFTNQEQLLMLENDSLRVFLYQLFTFVGYAIFCTFLFLPVQAWLSNVTPRWLGKLSLLVFSLLLPPSILCLMSLVAMGSYAGEEIIVTLTLSAMLFYLSVYAILWHQGGRWNGVISEKQDPKQTRRLGFFGKSFSLLRSGGKILILASTVAFVLLSVVWTALHLTGGEAQDVELVNKKIHTLVDSEDDDRDWIDAVNDHISKGITAENNLAVKVIKICNPYVVSLKGGMFSGPAKYTFAAHAPDPGRRQEIERLGLAIEEIVHYPPLQVEQWLADREYDFKQQLRADFPALAKRMESDPEFYDDTDLEAESAASTAGPQAGEAELTRDEKMAEYFIRNRIVIQALTVTPWSKADCGLGAEFVQSHRAITEQLIELSKETVFYIPIFRRADGTIARHIVFSHLFENLGLLLTATGYFDLGSGDAENAVVICESLWRLAELSPSEGGRFSGIVLAQARSLSKAIAFSEAATQSQKRSVLKRWLESSQNEDSLLQNQKLNRVFHLGQVYDRMAAPTSLTSYKAVHEPFLFWYQKFPWLVDWKSFLDRTEQLVDQFDQSEREIKAGNLTKEEIQSRLDEFSGKKFSNGWWMSLDRFNSLPAQQFSNFAHGPKSKGKMLGESFTVDTYNRFSTLAIVPRIRALGRELDKTAIGLEVYKSKHSNYPASLKDLVPEILPAIPVDPITLFDLVYAPTKTGFQLYSIGKNGVDDGGDQELDVVFSPPAKNLREFIFGAQ